METRDTRPDTSKDDPQRPDRAKHDELGRTTAAHPTRSSPREQPAKAVHQRDQQTDGVRSTEHPARPVDDDQDVGKGAVEE
ncbi:MAG: hypothetical protein ACRD1Q_12795 [Vicinamibacterales bacterium]